MRVSEERYLQCQGGLNSCTKINSILIDRFEKLRDSAVREISRLKQQVLHASVNDPDKCTMLRYQISEMEEKYRQNLDQALSTNQALTKQLARLAMNDDGNARLMKCTAELQEATREREFLRKKLREDAANASSRMKKVCDKRVLDAIRELTERHNLQLEEIQTELTIERERHEACQQRMVDHLREMQMSKSFTSNQAEDRIRILEQELVEEKERARTLYEQCQTQLIIARQNRKQAEDNLNYCLQREKKLQEEKDDIIRASLAPRKLSASAYGGIPPAPPLPGAFASGGIALPGAFASGGIPPAPPLPQNGGVAQASQRGAPTPREAPALLFSPADLRGVQLRRREAPTPQEAPKPGGLLAAMAARRKAMNGRQSSTNNSRKSSTAWE